MRNGRTHNSTAKEQGVVNMTFRTKNPLSHLYSACSLACLLPILFTSQLMQAQQNLAMVHGNIEDNTPISQGRALEQNAPASVPEDISQAILKPGFVLRMDVYREPDMSVNVMVDSNGSVSLPLVGKVHVEGYQLSEAEGVIAKAFSDGQILKNPQITLNIQAYAPLYITVDGEVGAPGRLQVFSNKTLQQVLAMAGGETLTAGASIDVQHKSESGEVTTHRVTYARGDSIDHLGNQIVTPGDIVTVQKAGIVYVLGAVNRPGGYLLTNGGRLNVTEAISLATGTNMIASLDKVLVLRKTSDHVERLEVPLKAMETGKQAQFELQDQDIVYVPVNKMMELLVNTQEVLATTSAALIYTGANH
jgi:polysaccharide export outer membrane protein